MEKVQGVFADAPMCMTCGTKIGPWVLLRLRRLREHRQKTGQTTDGRSMSARQACVLCGQDRELTFEDISPSWMRRVSSTLRGPGGEVNKGPRHRIRICRVCNEAMGRSIEQPAADVMSPLIAGGGANLERRDLVAISTWITKHTLLSIYADTPEDAWGKELNLELLRDFYRGFGRFPPNTVIRIGHLGNGADHYTGNLLPPRMPRFAWFSVSRSGYLIWDIYIGLDPFGAFAQWTADRQDSMIPIWPLPATVPVWPPQLGLDVPQIEAMRAHVVHHRADRSNLALPRSRKS